MKTFKFWTDGGDRDDIEAESLTEAAAIATGQISIPQWNDGAWGIVRDPETDEQMDVPSRESVAADVAAEEAADDEAGITDTERRGWGMGE